MDSLFIIDESKKTRDIKKEILKDFRQDFIGAKLTRTEGKGETETQRVIVPDNDKLRFTGFRISRTDLMRYISALSADLPDLKTTLDTLLEAGDADENHALNDKGRAIWVDLGYGLAGPRTINNKTKGSGKELQLVITAVEDGSHPADREIGLVCATTASPKRGIKQTDPPFSGTVNPMN